MLLIGQDYLPRSLPLFPFLLPLSQPVGGQAELKALRKPRVYLPLVMPHILAYALLYLPAAIGCFKKNSSQSVAYHLASLSAEHSFFAVNDIPRTCGAAVHIFTFPSCQPVQSQQFACSAYPGQT